MHVSSIARSAMRRSSLLSPSLRRPRPLALALGQCSPLRQHQRRSISLADLIYDRLPEGPPTEPLSQRKPLEPLPQKRLKQDDLFHPISTSPFEDLRLRAERIKMMAPCPVCLDHFGERNLVEFDSPEAGWPTHCSKEHYEQDDQHHLYAPRLREANEDEHDLRSGRLLAEFQNLPGFQDEEDAVNFTDWDTFFFTRAFPSMDNMRVYRNMTKVLSFPITVGSVLHNLSPYTRGNSRLTLEGERSLTALRSTLFPERSPKPIPGLNNVVRIFIIGARHESALPYPNWQQLSRLYPKAVLKIYFIGPNAALPKNWTPNMVYDTTQDEMYEGEMERQRQKAEEEARANGEAPPENTFFNQSQASPRSTSGSTSSTTASPSDPIPSSSTSTSPSTSASSAASSSSNPSPLTSPLASSPSSRPPPSTESTSWPTPDYSTSSSTNSSPKLASSETRALNKHNPTATSPALRPTRDVDHLPLDSPERAFYPYKEMDSHIKSVAPIPDSIDPSTLSPTVGSYGPTWFLPPTPTLLSVHGPNPQVPGRDETRNYGVPAWTTPVSAEMTLSSIQAPYDQIHEQFGPFDPYSDVFFAFCPGFGFPSSVNPGLPQVHRDAEWGETLPLILQTKCPLFVTGFSPSDVERDVKSLKGLEDVEGMFDWILNPGENFFGSDKWDVADFDPRVLIKSNWGIWGIRGKMNEISEVDEGAWGLVEKQTRV